jgi:hypothetical protein
MRRSFRLLRLTRSATAVRGSRVSKGDVGVGTRLLKQREKAIEVTKTNVALARSEGLSRTKRQSEVIRRFL